MRADRAAVYDLLAEYGALIDAARFDEWLGLFAQECGYQILPRENLDRGLPAALIFCDSRAMLEDRIRALQHPHRSAHHRPAAHSRGEGRRGLGRGAVRHLPERSGG